MIGYSFSQNKDRGVAPVNDDVWRQKKAMVSTDDTGALRPDKRPRWKRRRINQWILRWARRSRVLRGAFKNGERLPLETLQAKVWNPKKSNSMMADCEKHEPKTVPEKRSPYAGRMTTLCSEGVRFLGIIFGPLLFAVIVG